MQSDYSNNDVGVFVDQVVVRKRTSGAQAGVSDIAPGQARSTPTPGNWDLRPGWAR